MPEGYLYQRKTKKISKKHRLSFEVQKVYRSLLVVLSVIIVFLGVTMLAIGSQKNAKGYVLRELQLKNSELSSQNKNLDTKITNSRTLETIQSNEKTLEMEPTTETNENLTFVEEEGSLAAR